MDQIVKYAEDPKFRDAIRIIAEDLRRFARWEYENSETPKPGPVKILRRRTLEYAADYIERAL